jgi:hypothetical protein
MKTLLLALLTANSALASAPSHREQTAELLARQALEARDPEARLASCNFRKLISDGVFTCHSAPTGPAAVCEDNSRSAPIYVVEGYLDVELQPQVGRVTFREGCEGR